MRVIIDRDDGTTVDVTEAVRATYDTAVGSMDYGSGFLSTEEVALIRAVGRAIGGQILPYCHDRCGTCGHDRERHPDPRAGWTSQQCWATSDGGWKQRQDDPQCPCPQFAETEATR